MLNVGSGEEILAAGRRLVPSLIKQPMRIFKERAALDKVSPVHCNVSALARLEKDRVRGIMRDQEIRKEWITIEQEYLPLELPELAGGVNVGDQRALYYLVRAFAPAKILEVGTHIGCSTVSAALAARELRRLRPELQTQVVTVDIKDTNDPALGAWREKGAKYSPLEMVQQVGCADFVRFVACPSQSFFQESTAREYDFIFLDGDHAASAVYQDIPAALLRLKPGGVVVVHDFVPQLKRLWPSQKVIPGIYLALERFQREKAPFKVIPLGVLPWRTKEDSCTTSLAVLSAA